jgi:predicted TIM-barrel fold metal-dependent hydrolase
MALRWFDCNCGFGVPPKPEGSVLPTVEALLGEMDFCGVGEGLAYHTAMREESPEVGNSLVVANTRGEPRLQTTWAILPPQTGELGTADDFLARMREQGVRALWAHPDEHRYALNGITFGTLFEGLAAKKVPLLVGPDWQAATALLGDFPELTLLVTNHSDWGDDRYFRPLIERYPRLHLDTSNYQLAGGLADFVHKYGPERLLYGSGTPTLQMGAALMALAGADMPEEAKAAIAGDNLRRLLAEVRL